MKKTIELTNQRGLRVELSEFNGTKRAKIAPMFRRKGEETWNYFKAQATFKSLQQIDDTIQALTELKEVCMKEKIFEEKKEQQKTVADVVKLAEKMVNEGIDPETVAKITGVKVAPKKKEEEVIELDLEQYLAKLPPEKARSLGAKLLRRKR